MRGDAAAVNLRAQRRLASFSVIPLTATLTPPA
jgi:hypothetical protein